MPEFIKWPGLLLFAAAIAALEDCKSFGGFMYDWMLHIGFLVIGLSIIFPFVWPFRFNKEKYPDREPKPVYWHIYRWIQDRFKKD